VLEGGLFSASYRGRGRMPEELPAQPKRKNFFKNRAAPPEAFSGLRVAVSFFGYYVYVFSQVADVEQIAPLLFRSHG